MPVAERTQYPIHPILETATFLPPIQHLVRHDHIPGVLSRGRRRVMFFLLQCKIYSYICILAYTNTHTHTPTMLKKSLLLALGIRTGYKYGRKRERTKRSGEIEARGVRYAHTAQGHTLWRLFPVLDHRGVELR